MHIHIRNIHAYTYTQINIYTDTHVHTDTDTRIHAYTQTHLHRYIYTNIRTYTIIRKYTYSRIHTYTPTHRHKFTHPRISTYTKTEIEPQPRILTSADKMEHTEIPKDTNLHTHKFAYTDGKTSKAHINMHTCTHKNKRMHTSQILIHLHIDITTYKNTGEYKINIKVKRFIH